MASWNDGAAEEPNFARRVRARFTAHEHHTMATLRSDGPPRTSVTEVDLGVDGLALGVTGGSFRAAHLRRDGPTALRSRPDKPDDDPTARAGDAQISGAVTEVEQHAGPSGPDRFLIDLREVRLTHVGTPADHVVGETWHLGRDLDRVERRQPAPRSTPSARTQHRLAGQRARPVDGSRACCDADLPSAPGAESGPRSKHRARCCRRAGSRDG